MSELPHWRRVNPTLTAQAVVRAMLERVWERGDIYKADYEGALVHPRMSGSVPEL